MNFAFRQARAGVRYRYSRFCRHPPQRDVVVLRGIGLFDSVCGQSHRARSAPVLLSQQRALNKAKMLTENFY